MFESQNELSSHCDIERKLLNTGWNWIFLHIDAYMRMNGLFWFWKYNRFMCQIFLQNAYHSFLAFNRYGPLQKSSAWNNKNTKRLIFFLKFFLSFHNISKKNLKIQVTQKILRFLQFLFLEKTSINNFLHAYS